MISKIFRNNENIPCLESANEGQLIGLVRFVNKTDRVFTQCKSWEFQIFYIFSLQMNFNDMFSFDFLQVCIGIYITMFKSRE